jgi:hypothetical protein
MISKASTGSRSRRGERTRSRMLREPTPIPEDEARWAWEWMASWGLIHGTFDVTTQINRKIAREAHELAFAAHSR